ncbi:MAG: hypothetical protein IBX68_06245 [Dehalococcoidia bacterium]|nr:hypothetical protein [Dehalococcoidia bacterium]
MLELSVTLELDRQALRERAFRVLPGMQSCFFGLAALVFFACLLPQIVAPPVALATGPPEFVLVGTLLLVGCILASTVVAAPFGFIFF